MAMQWSFSSGASRRGVMSAAALLAAACVTTTVRTFLPSPQNPTYTATAAEPVLAEYARLQCEALRKAERPDSGTARFVVDVDTAGAATRAELARGTPDALLDGVFGTVAAQLTFARAPRPRRERVDIAWRCEGDRASVAVRTTPGE